MPRNSIHVQTETKESYEKDRKITAKQWKIYYYLLSQSKFNSEQIENHRYIYKKDFNISACCRFLDIKSTKTFYNAIEALQKKHLVIDDGKHFILYARIWVDINKDVLSNLVKFSVNTNDEASQADKKKKEQDIDLLRTYLIIKKIDQLAENSSERCFTRRQLILLLGHSDNTTEYYDKIRVYLALLVFWGLIELKYHTAYGNDNGKYTIYHIQKVNELPSNPDFEEDINGEMNASIPSQALMDKLQFCVPEFLN